MNSKTSLTLGMAAMLTLGIVIIFASPLSATTSMAGSGMIMYTPSSSSLQLSFWISCLSSYFVKII
jgi:hypothetical protein